MLGGQGHRGGVTQATWGAGAPWGGDAGDVGGRGTVGG
jgi:hypothetical protein